MRGAVALNGMFGVLQNTDSNNAWGDDGNR